MFNILLRKLLLSVMALLIVVTFTFALMHALPGDPFHQKQALPKEIHESLRTHYGLNAPWLFQYGKYLSRLATLDLGSSLIYKNRKVTAIIQEGFPVSALLGGIALCLSVPSGILLGIMAARKQDHFLDSVIMSAAIIAISIPSYLLATFLQYFLSIKWGFFPMARWESFVHLILPALSLAALPTAFIARLTRTKLIDEHQQDYVVTAYAKGLSENRILFSHVFRNILAPILSYVGPLAANILTGSFIVEKIYSIPGLGYWFIAAVFNRDYPLIMGITLFYCALLLICMLISDLICLFIDPRLSASMTRDP